MGRNGTWPPCSTPAARGSLSRRHDLVLYTSVLSDGMERSRRDRRREDRRGQWGSTVTNGSSSRRATRSGLLDSTAYQMLDLVCLDGQPCRHHVILYASVVSDRWTDLGVTGNVALAAGTYGSTISNGSFSKSGGNSERTCVL